VKILEKMLQIESEATQIIENAKLEAEQIRKKARAEASQIIETGKKASQERLQQEIARLDAEAETRKNTILQDAEGQIVKLERITPASLDRVAEQAVEMLLANIQRN
jgi:vacuolar-type H+-ATPase subunit H